MLANYYPGGGTWQAHGIRAGRVLDKVALIADGSAALGDFARELVESASARASSAPPGEPPDHAPAALSMASAARRRPWRPWITAAARSSRPRSAVSPSSRASAPCICASVKP
jgi:hypothetical protein